MEHGLPHCPSISNPVFDAFVEVLRLVNAKLFAGTGCPSLLQTAGKADYRSGCPLRLGVKLGRFFHLRFAKDDLGVRERKQALKLKVEALAVACSSKQLRFPATGSCHPRLSRRRRCGRREVSWRFRFSCSFVFPFGDLKPHCAASMRFGQTRDSSAVKSRRPCRNGCPAGAGPCSVIAPHSCDAFRTTHQFEASTWIRICRKEL